MKCDLCDKEATVHLTEIINSQMVEIHLCEDHAKEKGVLLNQSFSAADFFSNFSEALGEPHLLRDSVKMVCPACQMVYADFSKSGRLGCAECYKYFKSALLPLIKRVQRSSTHRGKRPGQPAKKIRPQTKMQKLQAELKQAVEVENFEEAARVRDEIKKLEIKRTPKRKS